MLNLERRNGENIPQTKKYSVSEVGVSLFNEVA